MELSSSFKFQHWNIKYALRNPDGRDQLSSEIVVFVHGTPWSSDVFLPIANALLAQQRYSILLYDLPGYGQSQGRERDNQCEQSRGDFDGDTSVKFQSTALTELLKYLSIDGRQGRSAPAVIAHDIAGTIALRSHLIHGCEFSSLFLLDTNAVLPWGDGFYNLVRSQPNALLLLPSDIFEAVVKAVIRSACSNPQNLYSGWEDALARPWIRSDVDSEIQVAAKQSNFVRQIAQANDDDVAEMLDRNLYKEVRCRVKILWGENDQWIPREKMDQLAGMLQHCLQGFVVVPEAGHLVMIDQPTRVVSEILTWLASQ